MPDNVIEVIDHTAEVMREYDRSKNAALEAIGIAAEGYAKLLTPVDTGRLRNSISHAVSGNDVYIGTNVEYAPYIELGTVRYTGKHMLKRAAAEHGETYRQIMERYFHD